MGTGGVGQRMAVGINAMSGHDLSYCLALGAHVRLRPHLFEFRDRGGFARGGRYLHDRDCIRCLYDGGYELAVGATGVGYYENRTVIQVLAVPEPSTYALIGGVLALAGVLIFRCRSDHRRIPNRATTRLVVT